jgi:hypothetical protein
MSLLGQIITHFRDSKDPSASVTYLEDTQVLEYTCASSGASQGFELDIQASPDNPIIIQEVMHVVETAIGGTPHVDVGDGSTVGYWIPYSKITSSAAGNLATSLSASRVEPKYLTTGAIIRVTVATSSDALGKGMLLVRLFRLAKPPYQGDSTSWASVSHV